MIPCIKTVRTLDQLASMPQSQLVKTCAECAVSTMCNMGTTITKEINFYKSEGHEEPAKQEEIPLEELARSSMNFSEYLQKAEQQRNGKNRYFTKNDNDLQQIAAESANFGEYMDRIEKLKGQD